MIHTLNPSAKQRRKATMIPGQPYLARYFPAPPIQIGYEYMSRAEAAILERLRDVSKRERKVGNA